MNDSRGHACGGHGAAVRRPTPGGVRQDRTGQPPGRRRIRRAPAGDRQCGRCGRQCEENRRRDRGRCTTVASHQLDVTATIGISIYPDDGPDAETLGQARGHGDDCAKNRGRNTYQFFERLMDMPAVVGRHRAPTASRRGVQCGTARSSPRTRHCWWPLDGHVPHVNVAAEENP
ncbi:MAG: hypothetical protein MZW92_53460 [Comamonadaceae bacterium]|nr:hypothetical protein [Comamonadaceae bacterium]